MTNLKAYSVTEEGENTGGIVFASHSVVARRIGAKRYNDGQFAGLTCRRAPWADDFAEAGRVPASVAVAQGWHFECNWSGQMISEHWLDERDMPIDGIVGFIDGPVFACEEFRQKSIEQEASLAVYKTKVVAAFEDMVTERFGPADFVRDERHPHVFASHPELGWIHEQVLVGFRFPGMNHGPASLRFEQLPYRECGPPRPTYWCADGDRVAFEAFAALTKRTSS